MELKGTKINFLGDSITEGAGTSSHDKMFTMLIEREYGAICQNYGIGGTRIARQKTPTEEKWDRDFISRVPEMDNDADIVVVFGGTNDFGHGDAPLGTMDDRTPYTFYGALHCLYTALTEKYPDVPVVILTPLHRLNEDSPKGDNKPAPVGTLKEYVNIIREVAEYYSLPVLDLFKESGLQPKIPVIQQKYVPDGLHPNDDGNAILAHKIARFLETL
jgi:lysophospholipase L1-like esterase